MKLKTNRSAKKRFKITANGKILRNRAFGNHLLTHKSSKRKRKYRSHGLVDSADHARILKMLPNG